MSELQLFNVKEAAARLSISHWSVMGFIKAGKLRPIRLGRRVLLDGQELERFIAEAKAASDPRQDGNKE